LDVLLQPGQAWSSVQASDLDAPIAAMIKARARMVPFLNGNARLLGERSTSAPELELLSPQFANYWRGELASLQTAIADPEKKKLFQTTGAKVLELQRGLLLRLHDGGVPLIPGSGAPHPWLFPGAGLHDELALWQGAGLAPREVLRMATLGAAQALGIDKDRGSIEAGKYADLVLLRDDPTKDIGALRKPEWVVLRGSANSRSTLDSAVAALREQQVKAQVLASTPIEVGSPPKVEGELVLAGYCESSALGVRTAAERYTAVRSADGKLSFCGRRVVPQAEGAAVQIESLMRVSENKLEYFLIKLKTPKHELSVEGFLNATANQTRVERKADGAHIDLQTSPEPISVVDVGSVTTMLVIEATKDSGTFPVMTFHEGLEMEVVRWELSMGADGVHYLRTPEGPKIAAFDERGGIKGIREQSGSGTDETMGSNTLAKERPGLPFSASKLKEIERSRQRVEDAKKNAPPATEPPKSGGLK
ncbi:MAG: amidohydrolase family protein, partial [Planctomycetota bacterium]